MNSPGSTPVHMRAWPPPPSLPAAAAAELAQLEARLGQFADPQAREGLARIGEAAAARVLRQIGGSRNVKTLSGFIKYMVREEDKATKENEPMRRNARGIATAESRACSSGPSRGDESVSGPWYHNEDHIDVQSPYREEMAPQLPNHARMEMGSPNRWMPISLQDNDGSAREIACAIPNLATTAATIPSDSISLRHQADPLHINSLIQPVAPAMMGVRNLPWMAGENPAEWLSFLNQDYTTTRAMATSVSNQMRVQINSPIRAMPPLVGSPDKCVPNGLHIRMWTDSPVTNTTIHTPPRNVCTPSPVRDLSRRVQGMVVHSGNVRSSAPSPASFRATSNALRETASPQMLALEELEFRKIFMIFAYLSRNKIEDVLSVDEIRSFKHLSLARFESTIWSSFGRKCISHSDRAKNLDSDPSTTKVYHCNVEIRGDSVVKVFKGPYIENTRTHLQKVVGDDNVLVVKFMGESIDFETDSKTYFLPYHKVAEDGIVLGLRRYQFFLYKDGGKEEKKKENIIEEWNKNCTSAVRCYFVRTESGWNVDEPYILSGKTVGQARKLFMHIHTSPTLAKYMARFALILSKSITLDADLSALHVIQVDDKPCSDEHGHIVQRDGEPLIHTDGTGLISEDLVMKCPTSIFQGNFLKLQDVGDCDETQMKPRSSKRQRPMATQHPLLVQFRMFYNGSAVKGTALLDRRLPHGTILIRPSMIKIQTDPELYGAQSINSLELINMRTDPKIYNVQSVNSMEIVATSNRPRRTYTSKYLIALLHYGGVKSEYFMELLHSAIEGAENARYDYKDALNLAFIYADMEDSISVRMILSGIPLEEPYLQSRLAVMAQQERKGIKQGRLPVDDCFYLMGTTDPTGKLRPNEVCVILHEEQYSGDVLVYKHPGLHFGDIHVLTATYSKDIKEVVGYAKYAILFPTSGPRSLADEMANSDFDGDMYWISINPKLLEQFKPSKPWDQVIKPKKAPQKGPLEFGDSLERKLFDEFLRTRFSPSSALGTAADCWLAYMDRLLTDGLDEDEKKLIEKKMEELVDLYYLALDAPKTGDKIKIRNDLMIKQYPHFMDRKKQYHSASILGRIYDEAEKALSQQSENARLIKVTLDPRFMEREASAECKHLWSCHYREYLAESGPLIDVLDKEEKEMKFDQLYGKYKHLLYGAAEFEQSLRNLDDVFDEACTIYRIVYERAMDMGTSPNSVSRCSFVWKVAGRALCHFYALGSEGNKVLVPLPVARKFLAKGRR